VKGKAKKIAVCVALFAQGKKRKALIFAGSVCTNGKAQSQTINVVGIIYS
jgi:hypothetical protein